MFSSFAYSKTRAGAARFYPGTCCVFRSRKKTSESLNVVDSVTHNISTPCPHSGHHTGSTPSQAVYPFGKDSRQADIIQFL